MEQSGDPCMDRVDQRAASLGLHPDGAAIATVAVKQLDAVAVEPILTEGYLDRGD
jgi:hypothetical protein